METRKIKVCVMIDVSAEFEVSKTTSLLSPTADVALTEAVQKQLDKGYWSFIDV